MRKKSFLSRIKGDISFFLAYYREIGSKEKISLEVSESYTEKELLNYFLFNVGALALNLELVFVIAYLFYTLSGIIYMCLNVCLVASLLLCSVYTVCNLILSYNLYVFKSRKNKELKDVDTQN